MYRSASLRLPCVACGGEQPMARMELAPGGGHWCWRCRVSAQIVEHEDAPLAYARLRRGILIGAAVICALLVVYLVAGVVVMTMFRC